MFEAQRNKRMFKSRDFETEVQWATRLYMGSKQQMACEGEETMAEASRMKEKGQENKMKGRKGSAHNQSTQMSGG
jgi:hypothetical protein